MDALLGSGTKLLTTLVDDVSKGGLQTGATKQPGGIKDIKFGQGPLGFTIECMHVVSVDKDRQAARRGVNVGDRLMKVDGRQVPDFDLGDAEEESRAHDLVIKWLKEMPLPAVLTFVSSEPEGASEPEVAEAAFGGRVPSRSPEPPGSPEPSASDPEEATQRAMPADSQVLQAELRQERSARAQAEKKVNSLWKQMSQLKAENKEIMLVQSRSMAENSEAMDAAQKREQALKDEVAQLRQAVDAGGVENVTELAELRASNAQLQHSAGEANAKLSSAELRATNAETSARTLSKQLEGLEAAQEAELNILQDKLKAWEKDASKKFAEQEQKFKKQEEDTRQMFREAEKEAEQGVEDTIPDDVEMPPEAPSRIGSDSHDSNALFDRISYLERRCIVLQNKLKSRSSGALNASPGDSIVAAARQEPPSWAPRLVSFVGLKAGERLIIVYTRMNVGLLRATLLILSRERWRWFFFAHLAALYTICGAWYSQTAAYPASPIDAINVRLDSATAAGHSGQ